MDLNLIRGADTIGMFCSLLKEGYLNKETSGTDKRSYSLTTTEKGNSLVETTSTEYYKSIEMLLDNMGDEKFAQLIELLELAGTDPIKLNKMFGYEVKAVELGFTNNETFDEALEVLIGYS